MKSILTTLFIMPLIFCINSTNGSAQCPNVLDTPGVLLLKNKSTHSFCEYDINGNFVQLHSQTPLLMRDLAFFMAIPVASDNILLKWEINKANLYKSFTVLRSNDLRSFSVIGKIAQPKIGFNVYTFLDENPDEGNNYYILAATIPGNKMVFSAIEKSYISKSKPIIETSSISVAGDNLILNYNLNYKNTFQLKIENIDSTLILDKKVNGFQGKNTYRLFIKQTGKYLITFSDEKNNKQDIFIKVDDTNHRINRMSYKTE